MFFLGSVPISETGTPYGSLGRCMEVDPRKLVYSLSS